MRVADFFHCSGIYADGLARAGWEVVGIDNDHRPLKYSPHETVHGDALTLLADKGFMSQFDAIHTSPPCQSHSATRALANAQGHGRGRAIDLVPQTLALLQAQDLPWTMENVPRSPVQHMPGAVQLCGGAFGLGVQRHRWFASDGFRLSGTGCEHRNFDPDPVTRKPRPWGVWYSKGQNIPEGGRTSPTLEHGMAVMGVTRTVPWRYLCESLPPAYGEHIGRQMLAQIGSRSLVFADTLF